MRLYFVILLAGWSGVSSMTVSNRRAAIYQVIRDACAIGTGVVTVSSTSVAKATAAASDPSVLAIEGGRIMVPRVGYSLYKTDPAQVEQCVKLALDAGVRHFDVGTAYGSNEQVGAAIRSSGLPRSDLFIAHKVSNDEQSKNGRNVKRSVKNQMSKLGVDYLDLGMVHSPLTDKVRRVQTYRALQELKEEGLVKSVGVCNYGVNPLDEILQAGLPVPSVIQLILSPFNQHKDVVSWALKHGTAMSCNAWSKLSSAQGPEKGWAVVGNIGQAKGMTKAQVLVAWALASGYLCVPRSGAKSKLERKAIEENSFGMVSQFQLTEDEMKILNGLDEQFPAGRLGILDGWSQSEIAGDDWDPTLAV